MLNKMLYKKRIERHEQCICAHPIVDGPLTLEAVVEFCHQILGSFNRPVRPKSNEVSSSIKRRHCETLRIYKWILFIHCSENERNLNIVLCNQVTSKSISLVAKRFSTFPHSFWIGSRPVMFLTVSKTSKKGLGVATKYQCAATATEGTSKCHGTVEIILSHLACLKSAGCLFVL